MRIKEFIKRLELQNQEYNIFFEIEGEEYGTGETKSFPISIKEIYQSDEKEITIRFEDN